MKQANLGLRVDELVARQAWLQARVRASSQNGIFSTSFPNAVARRSWAATGWG